MGTSKETRKNINIQTALLKEQFVNTVDSLCERLIPKTFLERIIRFNLLLVCKAMDKHEQFKTNMKLI